MKKIVSILVAVLIFVPAFVRAQTPEVPPDEKPNLAGYDGGFFLKSADDEFRLDIKGRHQVRYTFETKEQNVGSNANNVQHTFMIPRSRIIYGLKLFKDFSILGWYNQGTGGNVSWTVFSTYAFSPAFSVSFGMIGVPFDIADEGSSGGMMFIDSPVAYENAEDATNTNIASKPFGGLQDLGIRFDGQAGKVGYSLAIGNGEGHTAVNTNNEFIYAGRIWFDVLEPCAAAPESDLAYSEKPQWTISMGSMFHDEDAVDSKIVDGAETLTGAQLSWAHSMTVGTWFHYRGLALNTEGFYRRTKVAVPGTATVGTDGAITDVGYYTSLGYFVIPKSVELAAVSSQVYREGPDNNMFQFGGGLNWFPTKTNNIKWQFTYDYMLDYNQIEGLNNQSQHYIKTQVTVQW
jgi:hypothetical protein